MNNKTNNIVALTKCYFCLEDNEVLLGRRLQDMSAYNGIVVDMRPCPKCAELMQRGIILITIDNDRSEKDWFKSPMPNPYRTGGFFVVTENAIRRALPQNMADYAIQKRWMFIEHQAAAMLGLFQVRSEVCENEER